MFRVIVIVLLITFNFSGPSRAQFNFEISRNELARCNVDTCEGILQVVIQWMQVEASSSEEYHTFLGQLAAILLQDGNDEDPKVREKYASLLVMLSAYSREDEQAESFIWAAEMLLSDNMDLFDLSEPYAASPTR